VHRTVALAAQVAAALDTAHHHGLVHRDVKPANVLVTASDFAYLIDFGIARDTRQLDTALTPTGSVLGTPAYIAPERFGPAPPTGSSDIYSLACVLFEALAGRPPFPAADLAAVMRAHLLDTPPAVSATADQPLPHGVDTVISRGMANDPRARWPSATAMVDALSATTHPAIPPRSPRDIRRGTPPRRAGPTVAPPAPSPPRAAPPAPRPQPQRPPRPPRPLRPQRRPSGYQRAVMLFVVMFFVLAGVSAVVARSQRIPNVFTLPPGQQCAPHTVGLVLGEEYDLPARRREDQLHPYHRQGVGPGQLRLRRHHQRAQLDMARLAGDLGLDRVRRCVHRLVLRPQGPGLTSSQRPHHRVPKPSLLRHGRRLRRRRRGRTARRLPDHRRPVSGLIGHAERGGRHTATACLSEQPEPEDDERLES